MEFDKLVTDSIGDTLVSLWPAFAPELVICASIFVILIVRVFDWGRRVDPFLLALLGSALALYYAYPWQHLAEASRLPRYELFTGMLVYDPFTVFFRSLLLLFAVLFCIFTKLSGIPDRDAGPDFYCLVLGATLGMCLMASANHLLMVFLAVEMASVPSYALAALLKSRRESSEAALKYSVYGAGAAGVMLYGISLLAGVLNTAHLPSLAVQLAQRLPTMPSEQTMVLALGGLMVMVGLAFKLSAVPFHFWCPDVFEGASAEVNAFLSVASKAAALALLVRVSVGCGVIPATVVAPPISEPVVAASDDGGVRSSGLFAVADEPGHRTNAERQNGAASESPPLHGAVAALAPARNFIALVVAFFAVITCTFGNLAAYGQTNIKRLMAYSTIAHAGYMMLAVPAAMVLAGSDPEAAQGAIASIALYIAVYLFMNLGAFAIVAFLRNAMGSEQIADYAGLIRSVPGVVICFSIILFSLVGIPPLAGFVGKFAVFASLADGYEVSGRFFLIALLIVGGLNTAVSLFYYLRVVKVMTMDPDAEGRVPVSLPLVSLPGAYIFAITIPVVVLFFTWDSLNSWTRAAASQLF